MGDIGCGMAAFVDVLDSQIFAAPVGRQILGQWWWQTVLRK